jgi:RNA polymerase sigma-70 factor (ECF subfamily)
VSLDVESLYLRYAPLVRRRCQQLLRDAALSDDAVQEVFVNCLRRQDDMTAEYPSSLLFRMATNVCLNILRSRHRHPETRDEEVLLSIASQADEGSALEARSLLARIFGKEEESTRVMAVMYHLDGMTLEEVAKETGMSISGVRKRLLGLRSRVQSMKEVL